MALKLRAQCPRAQGGGAADKEAGRRGNAILPTRAPGSFKRLLGICSTTTQPFHAAAGLDLRLVEGVADRQRSAAERGPSPFRRTEMPFLEPKRAICPAKELDLLEAIVTEERLDGSIAHKQRVGDA